MKIDRIIYEKGGDIAEDVRFAALPRKGDELSDHTGWGKSRTIKYKVTRVVFTLLNLENIIFVYVK